MEVRSLHSAISREDVILLVNEGCDIEELLDHNNNFFGMDIPQTGPVTGHSPLYVSAERGNLEVVIALCELGANLEITCFWGLTPIGIATLRGNIDIVKYLISRGANYINCLRYASGEGHDDIVDYLLSFKNQDILEAHSYTGVTPLISACCSGHINIVEKLILAGCNVNAVTKKGNNALMEMINFKYTSGTVHIMHLLSVYGLNLYHKNKKLLDITELVEYSDSSSEHFKGFIDALINMGLNIEIND